MTFYILPEINSIFFIQGCQNLVPVFLSSISANILLWVPCISAKLDFPVAMPVLIPEVPLASKALPHRSASVVTPFYMDSVGTKRARENISAFLGILFCSHCIPWTLEP